MAEPPGVPDLHTHRLHLRRLVEADASGLHAAYAVLRRHTGQFVGMVNYHARHLRDRRLAVGWILARPWWRQGLAAEASAALFDHCFTTPGTHRIEAHIEPANTVSLRLAGRLGFHHEGTMRDWLFLADQPRDMLLYALLRPDWSAAHG